MLVEPHCRLHPNDPKSPVPITRDMESIITNKGRSESAPFISLSTFWGNVTTTRKEIFRGEQSVRKRQKEEP